MTATDTPWPPPIAQQTYRLRSNTGSFVSPLTGTMQRTARSGARWEFEVQFHLLDTTRMATWRGFLASVQDEAMTFYWSPYPLGRPQNYPNGIDDAVTFDATDMTMDSTAEGMDAAYSWGYPVVIAGSADTRELVITGMTPGAVFVVGDFFSVYNGEYRELHVLTAGVIVNASGYETFRFSPELRRPLASYDTQEVIFDGNTSAMNRLAACEVIVASPDAAAYSLSGYQASTSLKLVEAIR